MRVIGTAGHVDHGKSTLIAALTGTHPDRLKEEQAREMTIELGFGWLTLPNGEEVGIVDVPGHRDFIENMLSGIGGIDAALLIIAADEGVMPQTKEHLAILDLLQIPAVLIVLTKIDLASNPAWLDLVETDIRAAVAGTVMKDVPILRVSAKTKTGLDSLISSLQSLLAENDGAAHQVGFYSITGVENSVDPEDLVTFNLDDVSLVLTDCTISGNAGTAGVTLTYTEGTAKTVTSAADGSYAFTITSPHWSGTVTPSHPCYTFNPASRPYNNITTNLPNQNYTATVNPSAGCKNVNVTIGGTSRGNYAVPPQGSQRLSYAGLDNGPVKVGSTDTTPIIASERINLKAYTAYNSYGEVMGLPASKLSDTYIFPWYNNTGFLDSQLRFANVGNTDTIVTIKIAGVAQTVTYPLAPNQGARVTYAGIDNGPVEVKSSNGVPIIAAMRINLKVNSAYTSYSEFLGLSASNMASTRYVFPWYNNTLFVPISRHGCSGFPLPSTL